MNFDQILSLSNAIVSLLAGGSIGWIVRLYAEKTFLENAKIKKELFFVYRQLLFWKNYEDTITTEFPEIMNNLSPTILGRNRQFRSLVRNRHTDVSSVHLRSIYSIRQRLEDLSK
ncbi:MAG: hypothetical protein L6Q54_04165 [Leptospiraceae bacterium]|nr:hypothetical protein [Leptospiraceae bacterium]MCK6380430.1 hypothetical protein [Leptospiraceae bacterium]NUM41903.1 hypothetical protein [Leptospiraceae bacterium]